MSGTTGPRWDRRRFLTRCAAASAALAATGSRFDRGGIDLVPARAEDRLETRIPVAGEAALSDVPASWWDAAGDGAIECRLCPRGCRVGDGDRGFCKVRANRRGEYRTLVHSRVCAMHPDPIEKKPFFHVMPGTRAFSISAGGCNLRCRFCQNWEISQPDPEEIPKVEATPEEIAAAAIQSGCPLVAHTYSEPTVAWEFVRDSAIAARARGLGTVVISNGFIREEPLREVAPRLTAMKVDLKGFTERYYEEVCGASLAPVLRTLETLKESGTWFEIVVLVVPTLNDDDASMRAMCGWIAGRLGVDVPVHFTRFHPAWRLRNLPSTPIATLERIVAIAREAGLRFVYLGNVPGHPAENTVCPDCGKMLIQRSVYTVLEIALIDGRCPSCKRAIPGVWA